jgi:hypothetical protein
LASFLEPGVLKIDSNYTSENLLQYIYTWLPPSWAKSRLFLGVWKDICATAEALSESIFIKPDPRKGLAPLYSLASGDLQNQCLSKKRVSSSSWANNRLLLAFKKTFFQSVLVKGIPKERFDLHLWQFLD